MVVRQRVKEANTRCVVEQVSTMGSWGSVLTGFWERELQHTAEFLPQG